MFNYVKLVFQKYATFTGRSARPEYWWFFLFNLIIGVGLNVAALAVPLLSILAVIYSLATLLPGLAVGVRRLHDINKSGWFLLVALIPLIGSIWLIVLLATEGNPGPNEYGQAPGSEKQGFDFESNQFSR